MGLKLHELIIHESKQFVFILEYQINCNKKIYNGYIKDKQEDEVELITFRGAAFKYFILIKVRSVSPPYRDQGRTGKSTHEKNQEPEQLKKIQHA